MGPKMGPKQKMGPQMGPKMGHKQKMGPQMGPKMGPKQKWDMPTLGMGHAQPGMGHAQPGMGHAQPGHGTCPTWAWDMPTAPGVWTCPTNGPERPRAKQLGPNGPDFANKHENLLFTSSGAGARWYGEHKASSYIVREPPSIRNPPVLPGTSLAQLDPSMWAHVPRINRTQLGPK